MIFESDTAEIPEIGTHGPLKKVQGKGMTRTHTVPNVVWRAEEYHDLSLAQKIAATNLLQQLQIASNDQVLDVGCGNGKISADISLIANQGQVFAVDKSPEMISFATKTFPENRYPNLHFKVQDAEQIVCRKKFDIVFSSFCLQWVEDKNAFFKAAFNCLKTKGRLAGVIPLGISPELERAIDFVIQSSKWHSYYKEFLPGWFFSNEKEISYLLSQNLFETTLFSSSMQEVVFPSRKSLEQYILIWFPYLHPLPRTSKAKFFNCVMDEYFKLLPISCDGHARLRIPRLDFIAKKLPLHRR